MRSLSRVVFLTGVVVLRASAQTPDADPVVRSSPIVVEASRLIADAAGSTRLELDRASVQPTPSLREVTERTANLHLSSGGAGSFGDLLTLRGLGNTPYFSDPAVTMYFDDLPLGSGFTNPTTLFGVASATISRGPLAANVGRVGEAGLIQLTSPRPVGAATGEVRASFGNFDAYSAVVSATSAAAPAGDAAVTVAAAGRDGYIENTRLQRDVDSKQVWMGSARFRWRPAPASEISLQLLGDRAHDGAQPLVPLGGPLFRVNRGKEGVTDIRFAGVALTAAFDTSFGRLSATTSYTDFSLDPYRNELVLPPTLDSVLAQAQRIWSEELRLASAAAGETRWNAGAWWSHAHTTGAVNRSIPHVFTLEDSAYALSANTAAVFGDLTLFAREQWRVTLAARAEEVRKTFAREQQVPGPGYYAANRTFDAFSPKITVSTTLAPDTTASASVGAGTKSGGWSAYTDSPVLARFAAERTVAFEAGVETKLAQRTLTVAVRTFAYAIRDLQIERSFTASDYLVVNAPRARSAGGEVEVSWRPFAALTISGTLGITDVTLREFRDPFTGVSYAGKRAPYTPSFDANLAATYHHASGWFGSAELSAVGRTFYDESNAEAFSQKARATVGARFGYEAARWRFSVYGENLTDEGYYTLIVPGVGHGVPGAPRTYGIQIDVKQ